MKQYDHLSIEPKWQQQWAKDSVFATPKNPGPQKTYVLDMFPYPSGAGLHVGHLLGYTGTDVVSRVARMHGKSVLHPMGWDAFGLPAENYAIKTGVHPAISTEKNIPEFKRQLTLIGTSYDWAKEMNTSKPEYYKWTQWLFSLLYKRGLAYRKEGMVNWCPSCQTVLANEQVVNGRCERCSSTVEQRLLNQWYFKITDYTERLLQDLDGLDWPEKIKTMQRNWIGKSEGAEVSFHIENSLEEIIVFTTRPDTIFGVSFLVIAPEHPLVSQITASDHTSDVDAYVSESRKKTELERQYLDKAKTGVATGRYAINPANGKRLPIWIADYVLGGYGTGAVMGVPGHDERDKAFAHLYNLPVISVISEDGTLMNSDEFSGQVVKDALDQILSKINATKKVTYRLRDWLVSRQRFWGAPIPILYDENGCEMLVPETDLPVTLPMNIEFKPTGQSPLVDAPDWREIQIDGKQYIREADTLDTFVCSSWYYLRFPNPDYTDGPFDPEALKNWLPVDVYVGGAEHAVLHLLYARFITKVLYDEGLVAFQEPFQSLRNQGMILGPDHAKMSKSKGNVINPDDVVNEFGADTVRLYELFMGPFDQEKPWSVKGIIGVRRFLEKIWRLSEKVSPDTVSTQAQLKIVHQALSKSDTALTEYRFNTVVSTLMECVNALQEKEFISVEVFSILLRILSPLAPHITEELWSIHGLEGYCSVAPWPTLIPEYLVEDEIEYPIQINGKVRTKLVFSASLTSVEIEQKVLLDDIVMRWLAGATPKKVVVVPKRLVSIVV